MHAILYDEVNFQNFSSLNYSKYTLVHTCMYRHVRYRLQQSSTLHLITLHPPSSAFKSQQNVWLGPLSLFSSSSKSRPHSNHPGVACHTQSSTATCWPHTRCCHTYLPSEVVESAQPKGKTEPLCLLNLCGIVGVELPARNNGMRGTLPTIWSTGAT